MQAEHLSAQPRREVDGGEPLRAQVGKKKHAHTAPGVVSVPGPRTFVFSLENAVCKDSYRRQCREKTHAERIHQLIR